VAVDEAAAFGAVDDLGGEVGVPAEVLLEVVDAALGGGVGGVAVVEEVDGEHGLGELPALRRPAAGGGDHATLGGEEAGGAEEESGHGGHRPGD